MYLSLSHSQKIQLSNENKDLIKLSQSCQAGCLNLYANEGDDYSKLHIKRSPQTRLKNKIKVNHS